MFWMKIVLDRLKKVFGSRLTKCDCVSPRLGQKIVVNGFLFCSFRKVVE